MWFLMYIYVFTCLAGMLPIKHEMVAVIVLWHTYLSKEWQEILHANNGRMESIRWPLARTYILRSTKAESNPKYQCKTMGKKCKIKVKVEAEKMCPEISRRMVRSAGLCPLRLRNIIGYKHSKPSGINSAEISMFYTKSRWTHH